MLLPWVLLIFQCVVSLKTFAPPVVLPLQRPPHRQGIRSTAHEVRQRSSSRLAGTLCSSRQISALGSPQAADVQKPSVLRLKDLSSTEYVGVLGVGSNCSTGQCVPAAELYVVFDTGSADVWVASDLCVYGPCTMTGRHRFNRSSSSTFHADPAMPSQSVFTQYATGSLSGVLGVDDLWLGPQLTAHDQQLGLISQETGAAFLTLPMDGIVGLGFQDLANTEMRTLLDTMVEEKLLPHVEFAFFFFQDVTKGGALIWGHAQQLQLHKGKMMWFPVPQEKYWSVPLRGFRLGRNSTTDLLHLLLPFETHPGDGPMTEATMDGPLFQAQLILDSGTTFFTAPPRLFNKLTSIVEPASCEAIHIFPDMVFSVGTSLKNRSAVQELVIPPEIYMVRDDWEQRCSPGIMNLAAVPEDPPMMILGEVFLRHFFSIYRRSAKGDSWVGLAPSKSDAEVEATLTSLSTR